MKKILYIFISVLILSVFSCDDFLKEDVRGILSPENFYNTDIEAIQASNGLYADIRSRSIYGFWAALHSLTCYGADEVGPNRQQGAVSDIQGYTINEANPGMSAEVWRNLFNTVVDANSVINNVENNEKLSEEVRKRVLGEGLFFRAFAYYHLTNLWGDVPYWREDLSVEETSILGRSNSEVIRNEMLEDLQRIVDEELLPSAYSKSNDKGRVTIWVARMLQAKIQMWQKKWQPALANCNSIINNSPHKLLSKYDDVFDSKNQYNDEVIWGLDYLINVQTHERTDAFNPRLRDEPKDSKLRNNLGAALAAIGQEFNGYGLTVPLPDLVKKFPVNDLRRPMNIMSNYLGYELNYQYMPKFMNLDFVESPRGNHGEMILIFRLSDVYLMAAECENELNGPTAAYPYINKIRERAYEPDQPFAGLSKEELRKKIYDERKWELACEGHRRYDLIRWGILIETVQNTEYRVYKVANTNIKPHHIKLPIYEEELTLNPALLESDPTNNGYR